MIWDLPLRVFHWALVLSIFGAVISAKLEMLWLHERFGLSVLALVAFRIVWGFNGGYYARFDQFVKTPRKFCKSLFSALTPEPEKNPGHSDHGGYAVLALIFISGFMSITGAFSSDDVLFEGPLLHLLPSMEKISTSLHDLGEPILFILISLHLSAILIYKYFKKQNLTFDMIEGGKKKIKNTRSTDGSISKKRCIFGLLIMVGFMILSQSLTYFRPEF